MATRPDGLPASPKTKTFDANKLNSLPKEHIESKAKLTTSETLIIVPNNFLPKLGKRLCEGYTVGKAIGKGLQAGVYELIRDDGTADPAKVLKAKHKYALLTKMQREWEVGRRISSLTDPAQSLPGFMSVGPAVCTAKGNFKGMVLERLDGKDTAKLMGKDTFHDIHYIREMLFSVFCALDVSQKQLGFHHSDLRLPNIMDIGPEPADSGLKPRGQQPLSFPGKSVMANQEGPGPAAMAVPAGRMVPTSAAPPSSEDQVVPFSPPLSEDSRPPSNTNQGQPSPGRPPLPPSNLNTAPPSTEQNGQAPHRLYASPFQAVSMDRRASWDVRDDLPTAGTGQGRLRHVPVDALGNLQAPGANRQFSLELTTYASIPVRAERSGFRPPHRYKVIDYGLADFEARYAAGMIGDAADKGTASAPKEESFRQRRKREKELEIDPAKATRKSMSLKMNVIPKVSLLERTWRYAWRKKGDVYHLLFDMSGYVDGRVWPAQDKTDVLLFLALMHHVTGTPLRAWFAEITGEHQDDQVLALQQRCLPCGIFERNDSVLHVIRATGVRLRGWFTARNPGLTAAEVLTSPFFKPCYAQNWAEGVRNHPSQLQEIQEE